MELLEDILEKNFSMIYKVFDWSQKSFNSLPMIDSVVSLHQIEGLCRMQWAQGDLSMNNGKDFLSRCYLQVLEIVSRYNGEFKISDMRELKWTESEN